MITSISKCVSDNINVTDNWEVAISGLDAEQNQLALSIDLESSHLRHPGELF